MHWFEIENPSDVESPAVLVFRARVEENIRQCISLARSLQQLRPHVKTSKIAEVNTMLLQQGISKFKCATIAEAEMMGLINAPDVLLAYQPVGPNQERLFNLIKKFPATGYSCLVDNTVLAAELSSLAVKDGTQLSVFIDLNIGMDRTGVIPAKALVLYEQVRQLPGLRFAGLHAYDGQIHDRNPEENRRLAMEGFSEVEELALHIRESGMVDFSIVAGGSVTYPVYRTMDLESSPGTFVFWDWGYKSLMPDEPFEFAAVLLSRVVSLPGEGLVCIDLGHKSVASENPLPRVHFLNEAGAVPVSHSEEHMVVKIPSGKKYKVGDLFYGVPVHVCPTISMYEQVTVVENQRATGNWKVIARNKKISI